MGRKLAIAGLVIGIAILGSQLETLRRFRDAEARIGMQAAAISALESEVKGWINRDRVHSLLNRIRQLKRPFVLVIGDSITEGAELPGHVCGYPVINAGISGSRVAHLIPLVEDIRAQGSHIAAAVIAIGVNDAQARYVTSFADLYSLLIDTIPRDAAKIVATPTPVDFSMPVGERIDPTKYAVVVAAVKRIAMEKDARLVDLSTLGMIDSVDGVHLKTDAYPTWVAALMGPLAHKLGCGNTADRS